MRGGLEVDSHIIRQPGAGSRACGGGKSPSAIGVSPVATWVRSVPASLADPQPAFGSHRPVGLSSSRRTKHRYIYAPTSTPSVLQLHLLPAGHLGVQQQCEACHGSLGTLLPTRGVSVISAGQALLHLRSDLRFICAPTTAPSVLHLDLLPASYQSS